MGETNPVSTDVLPTARIWQPLVCVSLLMSIGLSCLALESAVHSAALGVWMDEKWAAINETSNEYKRQYLDTEDRVLLEEVAALNPSHGGVYFFGASNMKWAMGTPGLPSEQRNLVHNFGAGEGSPYFHQQFTNYLMKDRNLLQAGPDNTLIVYGTSFINAKPASESPATVFSNMWRRYGLYQYDFKDGIRPVGGGSWLGAYALEKARCSSFVQGLIDRAGRMAVPKTLRRRKTSKDPAVYASDYRRRLGPQWEEGIKDHRRELQGWLDCVRAEKMNFAIVLLPLASWHKPLPYPAKYRSMIEEFCRTNQVPLIDYSNLLADDDFLDHIHVNQRGLPKTDAALMKIAREFLEKTGAWPGKKSPRLE
jgi:hypothetical protein